MDAKGQVAAERVFAHSGEGLALLCDWLVERSGCAPEAIAIAIETPHGPVVEALLERGFGVHAINPKQLDRFRDRHTVAGAKDDRRDARVLADALRTDPHCFRRLSVADPRLIELREWSRMAEELQQERTRLANRIRQQLWRYYPQVPELSEDVTADWLPVSGWRTASSKRPLVSSTNYASRSPAPIKRLIRMRDPAMPPSCGLFPMWAEWCWRRC
ncbi:IS110 family transposase [Microvirga vignae]|uniref:IS110 family transposase n=1 Tax=Microvirga vignae TaxID=1225564 RepID=UPI000AC3CA4E|nr:IS110 family transposase [Microvirga vignae]